MVSLRNCNRSEVKTLVNELVESMLSVGARLTPGYRPSHVVDTTSRTSYILAVRLHVALLEVRGKPMHVLAQHISK